MRDKSPLTPPPPLHARNFCTRRPTYSCHSIDGGHLGQFMDGQTRTRERCGVADCTLKYSGLPSGRPRSAKSGPCPRRIADTKRFALVLSIRQFAMLHIALPSFPPSRMRAKSYCCCLRPPPRHFHNGNLRRLRKKGPTPPPPPPPPQQQVMRLGTFRFRFRCKGTMSFFRDSVACLEQGAEGYKHKSRIVVVLTHLVLHWWPRLRWKKQSGVT